MASEGISTVGARLTLQNTPAFLRDASASADAMDKLAASLDRVAESGDAAAASVDRTDAAVAANRDVAASSAAVTAAETERVAAADASTAAMGRATKAVEAHKSALESLASNSVVKKGAVVGLGLAATAYEAVKQYSDYQSKITQLVTQANIPMADKNYYLKEGIALSNQLGVNVNSVADAYYRVASSATALHLSKQQITDYTKSALELGILAGGSMTPSQIENSSRVIGSMMNANLKGATTPAQITALINSAVGSGDIRMSDMIGSIGKGGLSAAHQVGISAPDLLAWIDSMTKMGGTPSQSGTLVAHAIQQMAGGSEQEQHVEQMIGIAPGQLQQIMSKQGIPAAMQFLQNSMQHFNPLSYYPKFGTEDPGSASALAQLKAWGILTPAELQTWTTGGKLDASDQANVVNQLAGKMFGGARQETPEQVILSGQVIGSALGTSKFAQLDAAIKKASTQSAFQSDLAQAENTPKFQMQRAESQLKNVLITIGQDITPAVTEGMKGLGEVGEYLASHAGVLKLGAAALVAYAGTSLAVMGASHVEKNIKGVQKIWNILSGSGGGTGGTSAVGALAPESVFSTAVDEFSMAVSRFAVGGAAGELGGAEAGATRLFDSNGFPIPKSSSTTAVEEILGGGTLTGSTASKSVITDVLGGSGSAVGSAVGTGANAAETLGAAGGSGILMSILSKLPAGVLAGVLRSAPGLTTALGSISPEAMGMILSNVLGLDAGNAGLSPTGKRPGALATATQDYNLAGLGGMTPAQLRAWLAQNPVSGMTKGHGKYGTSVAVSKAEANDLAGLVAARLLQMGAHPDTIPTHPAVMSAQALVNRANRMSASAHGYIGEGAWEASHRHDTHGVGHRTPATVIPNGAQGWTRSGPADSRANSELSAAAAAHKAAAAKIQEAAGLSKEGGQQLKDASRDEKDSSKTSGEAADKLKASATAHLAAAAALQAAAAQLSGAAAGGAAQLAAAVNKANADLTALK